MIRSVYTNKRLLKISKYQKMLMLKAYNIILLFTIYILALKSIIEMANYNQTRDGFILLIIYSLLIVLYIYIFSSLYYGLITPVKMYQSRAMIKLNVKKSRSSMYAFILSFLIAPMVYFVLANGFGLDITILYISIGIVIITFLINGFLMDFNDLGKIYKRSKKLQVDISEYKIFDKGIFENITLDQKYYLYSIREIIAADIRLNKKMTAEEFKELIDKQEYIFVSLITKQMEKLGK